MLRIWVVWLIGLWCLRLLGVCILVVCDLTHLRLRFAGCLRGLCLRVCGGLLWDCLVVS